MRIRERSAFPLGLGDGTRGVWTGKSRRRCHRAALPMGRASLAKWRGDGMINEETWAKGGEGEGKR